MRGPTIGVGGRSSSLRIVAKNEVYKEKGASWDMMHFVRRIGKGGGGGTPRVPCKGEKDGRGNLLFF